MLNITFPLRKAHSEYSICHSRKIIKTNDNVFTNYLKSGSFKKNPNFPKKIQNFQTFLRVFEISEKKSEHFQKKSKMFEILRTFYSIFFIYYVLYFLHFSSHLAYLSVKDFMLNCPFILIPII